MKKLFLFVCFLFIVTAWGGSVPADIFFEGKAAEIKVPAAKGADYVIRDAFGSTIRKGKVEAESVPLSGLPRGYYWMETGGKSTSFCVLAAPENRNADTPFCIDVAVRGGLGPFKGHLKDGWEFYRNLLNATGCKVIRERLYWFEIVRGDKYDFTWADRILDSLCGHEIKASFMIPPHSLVSDGKVLTDPLSIYRFARAVAEKYRDRAACWEFWNEQDLTGNFPAPPWKYTALQKAAYLGFKDGASDCTVTAGSFCTYPLERDMVSGQMFAGDMAQYCDLFNFHIYTPLVQYPGIIKMIRSFLKDVAGADMPIWITECGTHAEGDATPNGLSPGTLSLNHGQELLWAEFLPKSQIILQQLGVSRTFSFILRRHIEQGGLKEWGLLREDLSVKPGFAAYAVLNHELGSAKLCGEAALLPSGRVFEYRQPDGSYSLVAWNQSALDTGGGVVPPEEFSREYRSELSLPDAAGIRAVNVFGVPVKLIHDGGRVKIPVTRYPVYIHGFSSPLSDVCPPPSSEKRTEDGTFDKSIVLDADIIAKERLKITVWNLSATPKKGHITHNLAAGGGIPETLEIGPFQSVSFELSGAPADKQGAEFGGVFNGRKITRLVIPAQYFEMKSEAFNAADDPARWQENSSEKSRIIWDENVNALKIDGSFTRINKWIYPRFTLNRQEQAVFGKAVGMSFEIRTEQTRKNQSSPSLVWIAMTNRKKYRITYQPSFGEWVENRIMFPSGTIQSFEIGMNPKKDSITYWVRNIRLLYEK